MAQAPHKVLANQVGVEGARPYGIAGLTPAGSVVTARVQNAEGRRYVSDAPYLGPAVKCTGVRTRGGACRADAVPGEMYCRDHRQGE